MQTVTDQGSVEQAISPFPDFKRVIYRQNPLIEVVCQLKFSTILRIDTDPPAEFQDRIRSEFPILKDRSLSEFEMPPGLPLQIANMFRQSLATKQKPEAVYDFASADEKWTIRFTHDSVSLITTDYLRWEHFKARFEPVIRALLEVYAPSFFVRLGLRYQDLIRRSKLNLTGQPWSSLLKPQIAGLLTIPNLMVGEALSVALIRLPKEEASVRMRHGLAETAGIAEECYLIDCDFFAERRTHVADVFRTLDYFNSQSGRLFRWCIDDRLHYAMEPVPVE